MTDSHVTLVGNVTADPVVGNTKAGDVFTSFRIAVNHGHFDSQRGQWLETGTSFYKVSAFRALAVNTFESLTKGMPVVVQGRLKVTDWESGDKRGTDVQVTASEIGPNLNFGQADFTPVRRQHLSGADPADDENVRTALRGQPVESTQFGADGVGAEGVAAEPVAEEPGEDLGEDHSDEESMPISA